MELLDRARDWLSQDPDPVTRDELQRLIDADDTAELADRFGERLQFGTAGLRGALGAGPNRMNRVIVAQAASGLAAYLLEHEPGGGAGPRAASDCTATMSTPSRARVAPSASQSAYCWS
jgi:phosphomannomutase